MAYELSFDETVGTTVRRAAREQLGGAAAGLANGAAHDRGEAVHDARKRLKKSRALLRLVRSDMPASRFRGENRALRERGRSMSGARDADALIETVDRVTERAAGRVSTGAFEALRAEFVARAATERETEAALEDHAAGARALDARVADWPLEHCDDATLVAGLARTYTRGRDAFRRADRNPSTENLHAWRKRVKDLWYQQRLLRPAWPGMLKSQAAEAKHLSKVLGNDHDLAVLDAAISSRPAHAPAAEAEVEALLEVIANWRAELLDEARALGRRVYAESPKRFRGRMRRYVRLTAGEWSAGGVRLTR
jgi:CHAD domain-containing protein